MLRQEFVSNNAVTLEQALVMSQKWKRRTLAKNQATAGRRCWIRASAA